MGFRPITVKQWEEDLIRDGLPAVLDSHQVAAVLRCSTVNIRLKRDSGEIASIHAKGSGRMLLFARKEVARYLADG